MIKLINIPWTVTRQDLMRIISRTLDTRVKSTRVLYDKETGLSRGIGLVMLESDKITKDFIRRGSITIEGRNVIVAKELREDFMGYKTDV